MFALLFRGVRVYAFAMLESLTSAQRTLDEFCKDIENSARISGIAGLLATRFREGGKILICGNGGSLADAVHFAEELTGRFRGDRPALPAIAIAEPGHITCTANDYGFERIFSRAVEALGRDGDVLIALSTSGNSENILLAVEAARSRRMGTVALLGRGGGRLKGVCDYEIIAPGSTADRIQEIHMLVLHILVELVEIELGYARK